MDWSKHWVGMLTDEKWEAAADIAQVEPWLPPLLFGCLFERATENGDGSITGFLPIVFAIRFHTTVEHVGRVLDAFRQLAIVAGDRLMNWAKRQGAAIARGVRSAIVPAKPSAARRKPGRRQSSPTSQGDLFDSPPTQATAAAAHEPAPEEAGAGEPAPPQTVVDLDRHRKRTSMLPPDWQPDERDVAFGESRGVVGEVLDREAEKFAAYHQAKGNRMLDWHAAWRTWVLRSILFSFNHGRGPHDDRTAATRRFEAGTAVLLAECERRERAREARERETNYG